MNRAGEKIYRTSRWKALRWQVLQRDNFRCVVCKARSPLEVDHIKAIRVAPELAYEITNLQTLCRRCHSRKTREEVLGPLNPEREKWRELVLDT